MFKVMDGVLHQLAILHHSAGSIESTSVCLSFLSFSPFLFCEACTTACIAMATGHALRLSWMGTNRVDVSSHQSSALRKVNFRFIIGRINSRWKKKRKNKYRVGCCAESCEEYRVQSSWL